MKNILQNSILAFGFIVGAFGCFLLWKQDAGKTINHIPVSIDWEGNVPPKQVKTIGGALKAALGRWKTDKPLPCQWVVTITKPQDPAQLFWVQAVSDECGSAHFFRICPKNALEVTAEVKSVILNREQMEKGRLRPD